MPRSILLPLLGLAGIVLFGTTRASRPAPTDVGPSRADPEWIEMGASEPLIRAEPVPPSPAPRLRSDIEAEDAENAARTAALADSARGLSSDSARAGSVPLRVEYAPSAGSRRAPPD